MKENVFIVFDKDAYFYPYEEECIYPYKKGTMYKHIINFFSILKLKFPQFLISKELRNKKIKKIVISDSIFSISLYKFLVRKFDKDSIYLYYMNVINNCNMYMFDFLNKENIYTFQVEDSKKFNIKYKITPYTNNIQITKIKKPEYDVCFLGRMKNRKNVIIDIYNELIKKNIKCKFLVLDENATISPNSIYINSFIKYNEYLHIVMNSKCILEIIENNQKAISLRAMESFFFQKKLITNCDSIIEAPFYNKDNIFIIKENNLTGLNEFINTPYNDKTLEEYKYIEFSSWLQSFGI